MDKHIMFCPHLCCIHFVCAIRTEDASPEDEKRKNYGGVYVGLPADLGNVNTAPTPPTHKGLISTTSFILVW